MSDSEGSDIDEYEEFNESETGDLSDYGTSASENEDDEEVIEQIDNEEGIDDLVLDGSFYRNTERTDESLNLLQVTPPDKRITFNFLTKFERARILGIRACDLENGAPPFTDIGTLDNSYDIAKKELEEGLLNYIISRPLNRIHTDGGQIENVLLSDLNIKCSAI